MQNVTVHVLENKCQNNGICHGPRWDPNCTSKARAKGEYHNQRILPVNAVPDNKIAYMLNSKKSMVFHVV